MENKPESSGGGFGALLAELKRRHVVRAVVAYSAVAFVVLQAAQIIQEAWEFPEWVLRLVVVFTLLGFPLVLALAWVYEITPLGLRTTRELDGESGVPESGGLPRVAFLIVTVVVVGISGWWWVRSTVGDAAGAGAAADGSAFPAALTRQPGDAIRSVAVLPFESFSPPPEGGRDYFAEGMHEALISQLSQVDFLRVLSRTSSSQIDTQGRSIPQIGAELGVDAIIEGSVLAAEGRVRITVQLIEVATDDHIWAQNYERDLVDIIALQREVAEEIVDELRGELAPTGVGEQQVTAAIPTATDPEAADALMKGRMGLADFGSARFASSSLDSVALHFQTAIRRDSSLAPAYRGLAQVYLMKALAEGTVPSPADIRAAWENAGRALALDPNSRETQEVIAHVGLFGADDLPPMPGGPFPQDIRMGSDSLGVIMVGDQAKPMLSVTEPGRQLQFAWARREAGSESPDAQMRAAHRFVSSGHPRRHERSCSGSFGSTRATSRLGTSWSRSTGCSATWTRS